MNVVAILIKTTIKGATAAAEHALQRCGVSKTTSVVATMRFETVNGYLTELLESKFSGEYRNLSPKERAAATA